ncbi:MAG: phosphatidate cytidylyltransferase [Treponemataceae bacterium]|nr:MAG: phosphatidate cytidylyltransferase [Treponemataceae bacterium]
MKYAGRKAAVMCAAERIERRKRVNVLLKEIVRKVIHLCAALVPLFLYAAFTPAIITLFALLALYCAAEFLRFQGITVPYISAITAAAARKRDENTFVLGPVTLTLGIIITALVFDPVSARIGILALAFGDGLASLVGKCFGKIKVPFTRGKTCAGCLACWTAVFISTFTVTRRADTSLIMAFAGMALELIPLRDFDNLILPIGLAALNYFAARIS